MFLALLTYIKDMQSWVPHQEHHVEPQPSVTTLSSDAIIVGAEQTPLTQHASIIRHVNLSDPK